MSYYISDPSLKERIKPIMPALFQNIDELYQLLVKKGWCQESTFSKKQWNPENKCSGQCNATVLLVKEYFGGEIIEYDAPSEDKSMHYFNRIKGCYIDLTSEQFQSTLNYSNKNKVKKSFGKYQWTHEKSCYILKLRMGLV